MKELIETADNKRSWHLDFLKYTESIVKTNAYNGLFYERGEDKKVKWVVAGKSVQGQQRRKWWDEQCRLNGINLEPGCYAKIALKLHPTKKHTCQICGKELSIEYVYPNKRTLQAIKKEFGVSISPFTLDIYKVVDDLVKSPEDLNKICRVFKIKSSENVKIPDLKNYIKEKFVNTFSKGVLSPGAMSNSPDRFDGYHSDGACCRHESDKGRHKTNLQRYGQDRRVYENWADGDWKKADRLMSLFRKYGLSADHIGPISLGFCHRPKFHPLTREQNSAKNNRMTLNDVKVLIADEQSEQVVSWHSKYIWDKLKGKVLSDKDAIKLSDLMRKNLHHVLIIFSMIDEWGYGEFLHQFLNPEYSFFDYQFEGFNESTGEYKKIVSKKLIGKNQQNNVQRYYRVAFEKLKEYKIIENRKVNIWNSKNIDKQLELLRELLGKKNESEAKKLLDNIFSKLADEANVVWSN